MEPGMPTRREPEDDPDAAFWNRAARAYSRSAIKDPAGYERTLSSTLDLLSAGDRVLELGCGTGQTALRLAPSIGHITGTDVSHEMIAIAEEANSLEKVLIDIADGLERRTARNLEVAVKLLEPAMLLVMAVGVMLVVAGLLMPIFDMGNSMSSG